MRVFEFEDLFSNVRPVPVKLPLARAMEGGSEAVSKYYAERETEMRANVKEPITRVDRKVGGVGAALDKAYFMPHKTVEEINTEAMAEKVATIYYDPMVEAGGRF